MANNGVSMVLGALGPKMVATELEGIVIARPMDHLGVRATSGTEILPYGAPKWPVGSWEVFATKIGS